MDTFHVEPNDGLAAQMVEQVAGAAINGKFVAIRGEEVEGYGEVAYGVFDAPEDFADPRAGYVWGYVSAGAWLKEFLTTRPEFQKATAEFRRGATRFDHLGGFENGIYSRAEYEAWWCAENIVGSPYESDFSNLAKFVGAALIADTRYCRNGVAVFRRVA